MKWSDLGDIVGKAAPALGTALAGPTGGAMGTALASLLGSDPTPESVKAAIDSNPEWALRARELEADLKKAVIAAQTAEVEAATKQQAAINETMRAELAAEGWFKSGWRPAIGWVMALAFGTMSVSMAIALLRDPSQLPSIMDGVITLVVAMGAVLGVNINARSKDKQAALTGEQPVTLMSALATRVAKR